MIRTRSLFVWCPSKDLHEDSPFTPWFSFWVGNSRLFIAITYEIPLFVAEISVYKRNHTVN